jgi:hypothetical protein
MPEWNRDLQLLLASNPHLDQAAVLDAAATGPALADSLL